MNAKSGYSVVVILVVFVLDALLVWAAWDWGVSPALGLPRVGFMQAVAMVALAEGLTRARSSGLALNEIRRWFYAADALVAKADTPTPTNRPDAGFLTLPAPQRGAGIGTH